MRRRRVLQAVSGALPLGLAGCTFFASEPDLSSVTTRPWQREDAVYHPAHGKGMRVLKTVQHGDRTVGIFYTYVERFWTVTGRQIQRVEAQEEYNAVHLMISVWDTDTGTALPVDSGLRIVVERDGQQVTERAPWPMLSQQMGFHFGDNVIFGDQATFTIDVEVGTVTVDRLGEFEGKFDESGVVSVEFDFLRGLRNEIAVEKYSDRRGNASARAPMEMEALPLSVAPDATELPGRILGTATSGDAVFIAAVSDSPDGQYLTVSPRTPYNEYVLPLMSLSASVTRNGSTVFEGALPVAIDPERGYHYGTRTDGIESGDELRITVDAPPQVARHEGYETAFLDMPPMVMTA